MLQYPQFKPHLHAEIGEEGVFLISETEIVVLHGRLPSLLAPLIDGRHSVDEIVDQLSDRASAAEVYYTLLELERQGRLVEGGMPFDRAEAAWWSIQGIDQMTASRRLSEARIEVAFLGELRTEPFQSALRSMGLMTGESDQLLVVLTDDYLRSALRDFNEEALRRNRPWLLAKPVGGAIWLGPLFRPGQTACWECLAQRMRANRAPEMHLLSRMGVEEILPVSIGRNPATFGAAVNLAAIEVAHWVAREKSECEGKLITFDMNTGTTQTHVVVRRPQCAVCGEPGREKAIAPVALSTQRKTFTWDCGHRVVYPEQTLSRFEHHVSAISGVVTRLERLAWPAQDVVPLYRSAHGLTMPHKNLNGLRNSLRWSCGGKGATDAQARVSGLCEALERYSANFAGDEPRRPATLRELGDKAIHPDSCLLFSNRQYRERDEWNARQCYFCLVPPRFDPDAVIDWSPIWSLSRKEVRYLPTGLCYLGYQRGTTEEEYVHSSNGVAAGNTLEEAILQGFLELVERDSAAIWWYNRTHRPCVDWRSFDDEHVRQIAIFLESRGRSLWVLDVTADLQAPTFVAVSRKVEGGPERILLGFGAHLEAAVALRRAVIELTQMLSWVLVDEGEEQTPHSHLAPVAADWLQTATLANQPHLAPDSDAPARQASDYPQLWSDDLKKDILYCQSLVESRGLEMLVLDLTRPDVGLPVVKIVVPGLRPLWPRFAPGRLYDAPVRQGHLPRPLTEAQLNPIPMFL